MEDITVHEIFMRRCIEIGLIAKERGESPVGSILVKDGRIVSEGVEAGKEHKDITYHAEIEAIRKCVNDLNIRDLSGFTLYTTHEPCIMCSYVIRHHRISTIVWGISTGTIGGYSSSHKLLADITIENWGATPKLIPGILEEKCYRMARI